MKFGNTLCIVIFPSAFCDCNARTKKTRLIELRPGYFSRMFSALVKHRRINVLLSKIFTSLIVRKIISMVMHAVRISGVMTCA